MFFSLLTVSILISISSNSILAVWIGLEINLVSIVPLFFLSEKKKIEKTIMIYFLIQTISSVFLMMSILGMNIFLNQKCLFLVIFFISLSMKMGIFPFHFWVPSVMEGLSWLNCFILSTIQKIVPLLILFNLTNQKVMMTFCLFNSLIACVSGITQFSLRKIMTFSSMNHLSFMILSLLLSKMLFKIYFFIYLVMTWWTFMVFSKFNLNFLYQIMTILKINKTLSLSLIINMLSMSGTPPFLGFFPKMMVIMKMIESDLILPSMILLFLNTIASFFYLRIATSSFFMNFSSLKFQKSSMTKFNFILPFFFMISPLVMMIWGLKLKKLLIFKIKFKLLFSTQLSL